jgi:hypothetical protein
MEQRSKYLTLDERRKLIEHGAIVAEKYGWFRLYRFVRADGTVYAREVLRNFKRTLRFNDGI